MTYTVRIRYIASNYSLPIAAEDQIATFDNRDDAWRFMREIDATDGVIAGYPQPTNH